MGELIGGEHRFIRPISSEDKLGGPEGEVTSIDLVQNLAIIQKRLMVAVKARTDLLRIPDRTEEQQAELEAKETEITELRSLASGQLIRESQRKFADDSGPPDPTDNSVA